MITYLAIAMTMLTLQPRTESSDKLAITCMHNLRGCSQVVHGRPTSGEPKPANVTLILQAATARRLGLSDEYGVGYVSVPMTREAALGLFDTDGERQEVTKEVWSEVWIAAAYALGRQDE